MKTFIKLLILGICYSLHFTSPIYCNNLFGKSNQNIHKSFQFLSNTLNIDNGFIKCSNMPNYNYPSISLTSQETDLPGEDLPENIQRVRISFIGPNGFTRYLLLGFTPDNAASDAVDYGYDGLNTEDFPNDMYWVINGNYYVIQGVGSFDSSKSYPLTIKLNDGGYFEISLNALENFNGPIDVFIYDSLLDQYFQINDSNYQNNLAAGTYSDRFFITFMDNASLNLDDNLNQDTVVQFLQKEQQLFIKTTNNVFPEEIILTNLVGQTIKKWSLPTSTNSLRIPITNLSKGVYLVKLKTNRGHFISKIIYAP